MIFGIRKKRQERALADRIYSQIVDGSRQTAFFTDFGVPDTLDGRFEMLSLHMFIALNGLTDGTDAEVSLAQHVMESFVRDMDASLRDLGVSDLRVPKRMKTLYGSFGGRMAGYRLARGEGQDALHTALVRNIYSDGGNEAIVVCLGQYVSDALAIVEKTPREELMQGNIDFPDANRYCFAAVPQRGNE